MPRQEPGPNLVDEPLFRFVTALEIQKALRLQYPVSVVAIRITLVAGSPVAEDEVRHLGETVCRVLRSMDLVAIAPALPGVRVLLADAYADDAEAVIRRIRSEVDRLAAMSFGTSCFPVTARSADELLAQADAQAQRPLPQRAGQDDR